LRLSLSKRGHQEHEIRDDLSCDSQQKIIAAELPEAYR
jgi:hypothetical protein